MASTTLNLSPARTRMLKVCADYILTHGGRSPTLRELGEELRDAAGPRGPTTVRDHILELARRGLLDYEPWKPRSIVLTPAGWEAMGCRDCECCGGTGRVSNGGR